MKITLSLFFMLLLFFFNACSTSSSYKPQSPGRQLQQITPSNLSSSINNVLHDTLLTSCIFGVKIISDNDGAVLYEMNSEKLFHPASNMKLLTSATALEMLPPEFLFTTSICYDGILNDSILSGNVFIKGVGDPLMTTEHLDSVVGQLLKKGIKLITGDIVGDVSYFDTLAWGMGWMWDDEPSTDAPFLTPLTINSNSIEVNIIPGKNIGEGPEVEIIPKTTYVNINNNAITSVDTMLPPLDVTRIRGKNTIVISGRIAPNSSMQDFGVSIYKPELYFLHLFRERLAEYGISVSGILRLDTVRSSAELVTIIHPLDSVLHQINKPSDNLAAENLLKTLSHEQYHAMGSATNGLSVIKQYLFSIGIDTTKMILADGSGLSWYNAVSPNTIVQLLYEQYKRKSTFKRFYESLPVAGVDGTLKNRMKGTLAEGNVHAKTGSLTGVSSLSGYVNSVDGEMIIFSILSNHFPSELVHLRNAQNNIMELLANYRHHK